MEQLKQKRLLLPLTCTLNYLVIKLFAPHYIILILLNTFFLIILPLILEKKEDYPPEVRQLYKHIADNNLAEFEILLNSMWKSIHEIQDLSYFGGHSLLNYAITYDSLPIIKYLLDKGFDINHRSKTNDTPLLRSISANKIEALKLILKYNPDLKIENDIVIIFTLPNIIIYFQIRIILKN